MLKVSNLLLMNEEQKKQMEVIRNEIRKYIELDPDLDRSDVNLTMSNLMERLQLNVRITREIQRTKNEKLPQN